jgi:putative restriction endonuclease
MSYAVFMHRSDSIYDDSPAEHYQFPKQYLSRAEKCVGDWIVYLEPSKVALSRGYFALAKVQQIIPDPKARDMYIAIIEPGTYLDFGAPVQFRDAQGVLERGILNAEGKISGRAQAAVRSISPQDFHRIVERGLDDQEPILPREPKPDLTRVGFEEEQAPFAFEQKRERVEALTTRIVRDRVFRKVVLRAYGERCAITGLKLINGGGRAEVDAAHIRPVQANGPDIVNNGIALSGTAHWMFDRGLITLGDNLDIKISRHVNDPEGVKGFINKAGVALMPERPSNQPHPLFLNWHRENVFKK